MNLREKLQMDSSIGLIVKLTEKSLERALDSELKERCGLAGSQWKIVMVLAISDGVNQRELAEMVFIDGSTLVPILDKMEKEGFLLRRQDTKDRRINRVFITPKSKKLVDVITECILDFRTKITKNIQRKDLEVTRDVLMKITQNADKIMLSKGIKIPSTILKKN